MGELLFGQILFSLLALKPHFLMMKEGKRLSGNLLGKERTEKKKVFEERSCLS